MRAGRLVLGVLLVACGSSVEPSAAPAAPTSEAVAPLEPPAEPEPEPPPPFGGDEGALTARRLVVGDGFTCALADDRRVTCWGRHPGVADSVAPTHVEALDGAVELVGEDATVCARDGRGRVRCIERADGLGAHRLVVEGATSIGVVGSSVCAVRADATVVCSGLGERQGAAIAAIADALALFSMHGHLCVTRREHPVLCLDGASDSSHELAGTEGVTRLGDVGGSACVIDANGRAACANDRFEPPEGLTDLDGGGARYCALTGAGEAWCLDLREFRRAGEDVVAIASRESHQCLLEASGAVRCRGANDAGQSAGVCPVARGTATAVRGLGPMVDLALGAGRACALDGEGRLFCWTAESEVAEPVDAPPLRALAGARFALCGLGARGDVRCFEHDRLVALRGIRVGSLADGTAHSLVATTTSGTPALVHTSADEPALTPLPSLAGATDLHATRIPSGLCGLRDGHLECVATDGEPAVPSLAGATRLFGDGVRNAALTPAGPVVWGLTDYRAVGDEVDSPTSVRDRPEPVAAPRLDGTTEILFEGHITRVMSDGSILESASSEPGWAPVAGLDGLGPLRRVAIAATDGCALGERGEVRCWGEAARGDGTPRTVSEWREIAGAR